MKTTVLAVTIYLEVATKAVGRASNDSQAHSRAGLYSTPAGHEIPARQWPSLGKGGRCLSRRNSKSRHFRNV